MIAYKLIKYYEMKKLSRELLGFGVLVTAIMSPVACDQMDKLYLIHETREKAEKAAKRAKKRLVNKGLELGQCEAAGYSEARWEKLKRRAAIGYLCGDIEVKCLKDRFASVPDYVCFQINTPKPKPKPKKDVCSDRVWKQLLPECLPRPQK